MALWLALPALAAAEQRPSYERVTFVSTDADGREKMLSADLLRPEGGGRRAAVVLMHGCAGPRAWGDLWARRLRRWGYVTMRPDSFGPRGIGDCGRGLATVDIRADDARAAWRYLAARDFVDNRRIGVIGMSHGATAALIAVGGRRGERRGTFAATVALYPRCYQVTAEAVVSPVLILIGRDDHLAPAVACRSLATRGSFRYPLDLMVYPGATHGFDWEGLDVVYHGERIRHDPAAAEDSVARVKSFLAAHLGTLATEP